MERHSVESSAIASVGYDEAARMLEIEFSAGRVYQYSDVPKSVYDWLVRTQNKGSYVARMINGRYNHRDVTPRAEAPAATQDLEKMLSDSVRWLEDKNR